MHAQAAVVPMLSAASDMQSAQAVREARDVFRRTLACWASDMLTLRHRGLNQATWTAASSRGLRQAA
jgi:hypothetical protein